MGAILEAMLWAGLCLVARPEAAGLAGGAGLLLLGALLQGAALRSFASTANLRFEPLRFMRHPYELGGLFTLMGVGLGSAHPFGFMAALGVYVFYYRRQMQAREKRWQACEDYELRGWLGQTGYALPYLRGSEGKNFANLKKLIFQAQKPVYPRPQFYLNLSFLLCCWALLFARLQLIDQSILRVGIGLLIGLYAIALAFLQAQSFSFPSIFRR